MVELRIRDNGRGIARDALDRVFDLFIQVDPNVGHCARWPGRRPCARAPHRRTAWWLCAGPQRRTGQGSEFFVRLPIGIHAPPRPEVAAPTSANRIPTNSCALRVLVVDDNVDSADSLKFLVDSMGHETRAVYDGPAAIASAEEFSPDVVLLDLGMPVMSGYEVARALRAPGGVIASWRSRAGVTKRLGARLARRGSINTSSSPWANRRSSSYWRAWLAGAVRAPDYYMTGPGGTCPRTAAAIRSIGIFGVRSA